MDALNGPHSLQEYDPHSEHCAITVAVLDFARRATAVMGSVYVARIIAAKG